MCSAHFDDRHMYGSNNIQAIFPRRDLKTSEIVWPVDISHLLLVKETSEDNQRNDMVTGLEIKKSSGRLLAINWGNIVPRYKVLVASLYNVNESAHSISGLLIFSTVADPRNSGKPAKSREIHKNVQNTPKFARNLIKYMSIQHI